MKMRSKMHAAAMALGDVEEPRRVVERDRQRAGVEEIRIIGAVRNRPGEDERHRRRDVPRRYYYYHNNIF